MYDRHIVNPVIIAVLSILLYKVKWNFTRRTGLDTGQAYINMPNLNN
jgi:hypothetical protein